jgi:hypothetical protein
MGAPASSVTVFIRKRWPSGEMSYCCLKGMEGADQGSFRRIRCLTFGKEER